MELSSTHFLGWAFAQSLCVVSSLTFRELFSSNSPNSLFDKAVADCLAHDKLLDMLGEPVKAFGKFIGVDIKGASSLLCAQERRIGDTAEPTEKNSIISTPKAGRGSVCSFIFKG